MAAAERVPPLEKCHPDPTPYNGNNARLCIISALVLLSSAVTGDGE